VSAALFDSIARIARHELRTQATAGIGVVTEVHPAGAAQKDHAATLKMRDTGIVLPRVPIAVGVLGWAAIPDVDDVVVVLFMDGDVNAPVIVGRLYTPDRDTPKHAEGELVLALPPGASQPDLELIVDGNAPSIRLELPGDVKVEIKDGSVKFNVGEMTVSLTGSGGGRAEIAAGSSKLTLQKDGDVTLTAGGKLKLEGTEVEISGSSKVKVSGAQVEIN
jgi:phage baseplate assembly protein gpV